MDVQSHWLDVVVSKRHPHFLDSSGSGTYIFTLLVFSDIFKVTLLHFLFFWRAFFLFVVVFGFDLCGPTLLGFLVGRTTLSMNPIRRADRNPKKRVREHSGEES